MALPVRHLPIDSTREASAPAGSGARAPRRPFRDNTKLLVFGVAALFAVLAGLVTLANRSAALAPDAARLAVGVRSPGWEPYVPRVSLTGRALFDAGLILLLVGGAQKRAVIEQTLADADFRPPVAALLRQTKSPVRELWSPGPA